MDVDARLLGLLSTLQQKNLDARFTGLGAVFLARATALARRLYGMNMVLGRRRGLYYASTEFILGVAAALWPGVLFAPSRGGPPPGGQFPAVPPLAGALFPVPPP